MENVIGAVHASWSVLCVYVIVPVKKERDFKNDERKET